MSEEECCEDCGSKMYGYYDPSNPYITFYICYVCGRFIGGSSSISDEFVEIMVRDPNIVLQMIAEKRLKPLIVG